MMKKLLLVSMSLLSTITVLYAQNKTEDDLVIKAIQEKDKQLELFIKAGLTDSIVNLFSPNSHCIPEFGSIVEGRDAIQKLITSEFKSGLKIVEFNLKALEHRVYRELVLELGTIGVKYITSASSAEVKTQYNYVINWKVSKKGIYRIRSVMWNSVKNPCN